MSRDAYVVWGMHRSGTSALSRVLSLLGAALPIDLMPPQADNPAGFWESSAVVRLNDRLLRSVGRTWYDPRPLPAEGLGAGLDAAVAAAEALLAEQWPSDDRPIVLKDPRLSRLGAVWLPALRQAGFSPRLILALRHPDEVAASLAARNGLPQDQSRLLWLRYTLEAWAHDIAPRAIIVYDRLLSDWRATLDHAADALGTTLESGHEAKSAIDGFLRPDLRHHRTAAKPEDNAELDPIAEIYCRLAAAPLGVIPRLAGMEEIQHHMMQSVTELWGDPAMKPITPRRTGAGVMDEAQAPEHATAEAAAASSRAVSHFLRNGFGRVEGWCIPHLWQAIQPLDAVQKEMGVQLPVAEIGVYHGKFLIGLIKTAMATSGNFAIDVFDMQQFNLDGAGQGNLEALRRNLDSNGIAPAAVEIMRADSMAIGDEQLAAIRNKVGAFAFFSVDGCHLPEHTVNDVRLAMRLTAPEGIIFVDDYYNANCPGVQEGVAKLYYSDSPKFVPLLYTCNKLFLCHVSFHRRYLQQVHAHVRNHFPETRIKNVARFGYDTLTILPDVRTCDYIVEVPTPHVELKSDS